MARRNQYPERIFTETHASCSKCNTLQPFSLFHKCKTNPKGIAYWCKECACKNSRKNHKLRVEKDPNYKIAKRDSYIKSKYGITLQEYLARLALQENRCAICGVELLNSGPLTHLDHSHKTGKLRAMLCTNCNRGLGHFKENVEILSKAIQYLNSHNS